MQRHKTLYAEDEWDSVAEIKMGRQPRSGDFSLAIGPLDPEMDRR
jgi:hypothetical protein